MAPWRLCPDWACVAPYNTEGDMTSTVWDISRDRKLPLTFPHDTIPVATVSGQTAVPEASSVMTSLAPSTVTKLRDFVAVRTCTKLHLRFSTHNTQNRSLLTIEITTKKSELTSRQKRSSARKFNESGKWLKEQLSSEAVTLGVPNESRSLQNCLYGHVMVTKPTAIIYPATVAFQAKIHEQCPQPSTRCYAAPLASDSRK